MLCTYKRLTRSTLLLYPPLQNHNLYNYGYYYNRTKDPDTARIAVIRTEFIEQ